MYKLNALPKGLDVANKHVMLHVRLKGLSSLVSGYTSLSREVLSCFREKNPTSIVVPTFTYGFTEALSFSLCDSPSEVGRFSEEVRLFSDVKSRTKDPVFSAIDALNYGWVNSEWNNEAFGDDSIWSEWDRINGIIVNVDLPEIVTTQLHYVEKVSQVPYRYNKTFNGSVFDNLNESKKLDYSYYVRDLTSNPKWNRELIRKELERTGVLSQAQWNGVNLCWFRANDMRNVIQPIMMESPEYFLQ